ncbi:MAG: 50S ribosomal protein L33 [Patescibacteria group bacterium]
MATKKAFTKIQCQICKKINYYTHKSKILAEKKLELKKFCKCCKKHTPHKEAKR